MLHGLGRLAAGCVVFWAALAGADDGVAPGRILVGQSITLQGGRNDYGVAVLAGVQAKALVQGLQLAGPNPTRESFVRGLYTAGRIDLGDGLRASYAPGDHTGLTLVDLAIVTRQGKFRH